jgi:hypothetical protein
VFEEDGTHWLARYLAPNFSQWLSKSLFYFSPKIPISKYELLILKHSFRIYKLLMEYEVFSITLLPMDRLQILLILIHTCSFSKQLADHPH